MTKGNELYKRKEYLETVDQYATNDKFRRAIKRSEFSITREPHTKKRHKRRERNKKIKLSGKLKGFWSYHILDFENNI